MELWTLENKLLESGTVARTEAHASSSTARFDNSPVPRFNDSTVQRCNDSTIPRFHGSTFLPLLLALASLLAFPVCAKGEKVPKTIYQWEANFICLIAKWTEWPQEAFADTPNKRAPLVIGILGKDPFEKDIDFIKDETPKNRELVIRKCSRVEEAKGCHILFISSSEKDRVAHILEALGNSSTLTMADFEGFTRQGGMINILAAKPREGFRQFHYEVNQSAAEKAKLRIHSYVLANATRS